MLHRAHHRRKAWPQVKPGHPQGALFEVVTRIPGNFGREPVLTAHQQAEAVGARGLCPFDCARLQRAPKHGEASAICRNIDAQGKIGTLVAKRCLEKLGTVERRQNRYLASGECTLMACIMARRLRCSNHKASRSPEC
jgi:hypothetical protein